MKNGFFIKFKIFYFLFCFFLVLVFGGKYYINTFLNKTQVSEKVESVPYFSVEEDCSLLFDFCGERVALDFSFLESQVSVCFIDKLPATQTNLRVLRADYILYTDYDTVGFLVDCVGGIVLDGSSSRYTGVQIIDILRYEDSSISQKYDIALKILNGISEVGFTKNNMLYLLELCDTDLTFYETLNWIDYIPTICKNVKILDT